MIPNYKQKEHADIAEQVAEFERLNGKIKTENIQTRGKDGKPISKAEKNMKKSSKSWGKKQQKLFGVKKGSKAL